MFFHMNFLKCISLYEIAKSIESPLKRVSSDSLFSNVNMRIYDSCQIDALKKYILYDPNHKPNCLQTRTVDLIANPETHTGYRYGAKQVWEHLLDVDDNLTFKKMMNALQYSIKIHVCSFYYFANKRYTSNFSLFNNLYKKYEHENFEWLLAYIYTQFLQADFDKLKLPTYITSLLRTMKTRLSTNLEKVKSGYDFQPKFQQCLDIMNCVGCQKCKLWGKIQIRGLLTASKIEKKKFDQNFGDYVFLINLMQRLTVSEIETKKFLDKKSKSKK